MAYWPAIHAGFIWDDDAYVTHERFARTWSDLWRIWTDVKFTPQYYPLVHTTYWIEYHLWHFNPVGYHTVNILLHAGTACGAALALVRLGWSRWPAWLAGALFALHPLNVESVAWVTERKNTLCGFFFVLTFHAMLSVYRIKRRETDVLTPWAKEDDREPFPWRMYLLALALFALTLTSKTVGSVLPGVVAVMLWWKGRRLDPRVVWPLVPMFVIGAGMGRITSWLEKTHVGAVGQDWDISFLDRTLIAGRVVCFYVGKWFWPEPLMLIYPRWKVSHEPWQFLFPLAAAAVLIALWALRDKIGRGPLAALLIYLGCLLPASGYFDIYPQRFSFVADHFCYLATLALAVFTIGAGWTLAEVIRPRISASRWLAGCAAVGVVIASVLLTNHRSRAYESLETIWQDNYEKDPDSLFALINLSHIRETQGKPDEALAMLQRAADLHKHPIAYTTLAIYLERHGKRDDAVMAYRQAVAGFRGIEPERGVAHQALGRLYMEAGKYSEAAGELMLALQCRPNDVESALHLGEILQQQNQFARAVPYFESVVAARPMHENSWLNLSLCYYQQRRFEDAASAAQRVLELDPKNARANHNLAVSLTAMGSPGAALKYFEAAMRGMPDDLSVPRNYAVALAATGQTRLAADVCMKAAQAAAARGDQQLAAEFEERAKRYSAAPGN